MIRTDPSHYILSPSEERKLPRLVLSIVLPHQGAAHPITAKEIARQAGMIGRDADRKVRAIVLELNLLGVPIAGSEIGYFWVTNQQEALDYLNNLRSRISGIWKRYRAFAHAAEKQFGIQSDQLRLEM